VKTELVDPAKASGYEKIILVGASLGGHGALLYIMQHPEDVDGVVVLAPFLGGGRVAEAIENAGGLEKWEDCPALEWDYPCHMWKLLKLVCQINTIKAPLFSVTAQRMDSPSRTASWPKSCRQKTSSPWPVDMIG